jgi:two-component system, cell cycle response regulator
MEEETIIQENTGKKKKNSFLSGRGVLVALSSENLGQSYIIDKEEVLIGRDSSCEIILEDPLVSKIHSRITMEEDKIFRIEDLGSTNGTYLNKKKLSKPAQIYYSDRIMFGSTIFRFFLEETLDKS